ncbi:hypothetical protein Neosp_014467 [[Neocosmospora] mangrovei]
MRSEIFALPLLALARGVLASPCLPPLTTSSLSVSTTSSSETESAASTESSTEPSIASTESTTATAASTGSTTVLTTTESTTVSASETATTSATLSSTSTESTGSTTAESTTATTSALSTASTEPTTTAAQSTTTSAEPEPQETNLLINGGFEASTPQPWRLFNSRNPGRLSISTEQFYVGHQSGTYEHSDNSLDEDWGIYQPIDNTRLVLGGRYIVSIRIRVPDNSCTDITLVPSVGSGGWIAQGSSPINVADAVNNWYEARAVFRYQQQWMINTEPGVAIISRCKSASFLVDDASMVQLVEPTD